MVCGYGFERPTSIKVVAAYPTVPMGDGWHVKLAGTLAAKRRGRLMGGSAEEPSNG